MVEIQRGQLEAFTEANTKAAVALEKLTGIMETVLRGQEKLVGTAETLSRLEGNQKDLKGMISITLPDTIDEKIKNSSMSKDVEHVKWFVGIIAIIIIVCTVILRFTDAGESSKATSMQTQILQKIIDQQNNHGLIYSDKDTKNGTQQ